MIKETSWVRLLIEEGESESRPSLKKKTQIICIIIEIKSLPSLAITSMVMN